MQGDDTEIRFGFGKNWSEFIARNFNETIIAQSERHLLDVLRLDSLEGLTFLDIGCGSGLHSLAALRLGAKAVVSFDYDAQSAATTRHLHQHAGAPEHWRVMQGSVLDAAFLDGLGRFDIVYSWGVLHHTGSMWEAIGNAARAIAPGGSFYIALYSSDLYVEPSPDDWIATKRAYNQAGPLRRQVMEWIYVWQQHIWPQIRAFRNPLPLIWNYSTRGMDYWTDVRDWLGGYPMEFASYDETRNFCARLGLASVDVRVGDGCTEYVFANLQQSDRWRAIVEGRHQTPLSGPYSRKLGKMFIAPLPADCEATADTPETPRRSRLMLYEDGEPLGLAHAIHDHVARFGGGRFSHWRGELWFSARDGSDPNTNGRRYSYCLDC